MYTLALSDIKEYLRKADKMFHFCLGDAPYEMNIIGNQWDATGIAFDKDLYGLLLNHMIPGGFLAMYSSTRTHHRMMVAMEDAGWIIHKAIMAWVYPDGNAQGAQNTSKRIDATFAKQYGGYCKCAVSHPVIRQGVGFLAEKFAQRGFDVIFCEGCDKPIKQTLVTIQHNKTGGMIKLGGSGYGNGNIQEINQPLTVESAATNGYVYGLGWGKPTLEPIVIAQAPYDYNSEFKCIIDNGTGLVRKLDKHPGNFVYMHHPQCTTAGCCAECIANQLKYSYQGFYHDLSDELESQVYSCTRARQERHDGLSEPNPHPSVKPLALGEWLGKIFLPPELYGPLSVLNPFGGTASEAIGLRRAGWTDITSVEIDTAYGQVNRDRYNYYFPDDRILVL